MIPTGGLEFGLRGRVTARIRVRDRMILLRLEGMIRGYTMARGTTARGTGVRVRAGGTVAFSQLEQDSSREAHGRVQQMI